MTKAEKRVPTDEEIMAYDNVPPGVAADYLGKTIPFLYAGLRYGTLPFGCGVQMTGGKWSYSISPGMLVAYKRGKMIINMPKGAE